MRLHTLAIALPFALALAACGGAQSGMNSPSVTPLADRLITTQSADVVTSNVIVPISVSQFVQCANLGRGEIVVLSGNLHMVARTTVTANNAHVMFSNNPQGVTGIGLVTHDKYQGTGVTRQDENVANGFFPMNLTFVNNFRIIGQGPGNNLLVHENSHITVNANRTITVNQTNLSIVCQ